MPVHNSDVADIFRRIADLLEIEGANEYRVRSYRQAASTVSNLSRNVAEMVEEGEDLTEIQDIGESIAEKIVEIAKTKDLEQLHELEDEVPPTLREILELEGVGPKTTKELHEELGVDDVDDLREAAKDGEVSELEGFGEKTEEKILEEIERVEESGEDRTRLDVAEEWAESLREYLEELDDTDRVTVAGSYRRRKATVGDLDVLVTCDDADAVMEAFASYDDVEELTSQGETKSTARLRSGLSVDLRVVEDASYGAALHYFTGSKAHNIACRQRGMDRGLKVNEYGVFEDDERVGGETEEEVYEMIDLPYIAPELREDRGELEAAENNELPDLIVLDDIRGDLHAHTERTDGKATIREMAEAAAERGYEYIAVTDHSQAMSMSFGLDADDLREQCEKIEGVDEDLDSIRVLKSCEVDILEDGSLDLPDEALEQLDLVVCSIHSELDLDQEAQTKRILTAMENPNLHILGHPLGRLLGDRPASDIDVERVLEQAADCGCAIELNASPQRLDLPDRYLKLARELGVPIVISTDAHSVQELAHMRYGIDQARRGWLEASDVLNTMSLDDFLQAIER